MGAASRRPVPVVAVIVVRDGKILVGERSDGHWALPGGKQRLWETPFEAAKRELAEETGLQLVSAVPVFFADCQHRDADQHFVTLFLEGEAVGEPQLCEPHSHRQWIWCEIDQMPKPRLTGSAQLLASGYRPAATRS